VPTFLDQLYSRVGADGLAAARRDPHLRAALRWHAEAVRATIASFGLPVDGASLTGYGSVLLIAAQRCGRLLPADPAGHDWTSAEWYLVRLVAVCELATGEAVPSGAGDHSLPTRTATRTR
jgi:hypothetical protein